jgi:hypothetical protein
MLPVFRKRRRVDQDIINIRGNKYIKEFTKRIVNILLEYTRTILYTK